MGTGEGGRRRRRMEGDEEEEDEEYVLEEEEEGLSASSGGEEGEGSDAEYQEDEEDEEDETPRPKRRTNPAAVRSRQRRYEEDDDYLEELGEDEEVDDYNEDLEEEEEEEAPRPKRIAKCGGRGQKGKLPRAAEGSNRRRHEDEDMDFDPDSDEEEEEDMDFDPEVEEEEEEEAEFEDEEEEELAVSHNRKLRVNNTVQRKPASKHRHRNKKNNCSKVSRRKVDSAKAVKATPVRRRRKRSVIDHYEEDDDFIVEDQVEVNRQSRKKARVGRQIEVARVGRQIEVNHPVPVVEEDIWPTVESDTSDFDFVTSDEEPEDVEPSVVELVRVTVRKGRKKRISWLESSSDSEFHVSDKELGDFRETEPLEAQPMLPASPRRISVIRNGEDKGKEKKEPEESGRPTCGICLSEEQKMTMQGVLNCCSHYFCFACIMEWSRVESRCPLCKQRFTTITKPSKADFGLELIKSVIRVEERDQVYQPTEDEIRRWLDPYENVVCIECNQGGDDSLMLLCDICDSSAHTYCVGLGREVPEGSWYCGGCRVSGEGPSYPRSPVNSNSEEFGTFERSPSINTRQTFQGIDLNESPREIPGENHLAESQASTMGVLTPSGRPATYSRRRQINEMISILLSRPRPPISPEVGHSGVQHSGSVPRAERNHRNFRAPSEANTSQHSGSVPRTEPNHRNFEAASEANTSHTLARRRRINEWISILLSRPRTISLEVGHSGTGVQHSGSVPITEPNHRNFRSPSEANTSQTLLDDIQNQHTGFPLVQAQGNFAPCISVDGNNFQQTEGVKSNVKHMCSISPR